MKICVSCNCSGDFYKGRSKCKTCIKARSREYARNNKEKVLANKRDYYNKNRDEILTEKREYYNQNKEICNKKSKEYRVKNKESLNEYNREYAKTHREEINKYVKLKKSEDICYKLSMILRKRTRNFIKSKGIKKSLRFEQYIGCSLNELKLYLESLFQPGMSWENYGYSGWHIDHKIPLKSSKTENELYKLCHYTNLQPLWALDNFKKGGR